METNISLPNFLSDPLPIPPPIRPPYTIADLLPRPPPQHHHHAHEHERLAWAIISPLVSIPRTFARGLCLMAIGLTVLYSRHSYYTLGTRTDVSISILALALLRYNEWERVLFVGQVGRAMRAGLSVNDEGEDWL